MQIRSLKLIAVTAGALGAAAAHAAGPTAELKVQGKLSVPACTVESPEGGVYDFGKLSSTLIKPGATTTPLSPLSKSWKVNCDASTYLTFSVVDNRAGSTSTPGTSNFGLGNVNGTGKIGYYTVKLTNPTVDGETSSTFTTANTTVNASTTASLTAGNTHGWAVSNALKPGKVFGIDLEVAPVLAGTTTMNGAIKDVVDLDGSLTLNYAFGL
ncbi:fimbrial assembly protein [Burkholderia territorii]|uniref:DUF1120 domain-containing protein n=1 Tax=Burkholderia territorii TaxID=1503055 RepID=UPI00084137D0|nr:DUF1120 domain-containing protein [Burkholderia territorii]AOI67590.1 fimbrial assembly protein [Burkholderia territorii]